MANDGKLGMGTKLLWKNTPAGYVQGTGAEVPGVIVIPEFSPSKPKVDTTNYGSGGKQYIQGLEEVADFTFEVQYNPADPVHQGLDAAYASGSDQQFELQYPFAVVHGDTFTGKVTAKPRKTSMEGVMTREYTVAVNVSSVTPF